MSNLPDHIPPMKPFRFFCQKVIPLVYDETLTQYELLCKVVYFLNQVIENENEQNEAINTLIDNFDSLRNFVNEYKQASDEEIAKIDAKVDNFINTILDNPGFMEDIQIAVNTWLTDHPEATTTVQDGSITEQKLNEQLKNKLAKLPVNELYELAYFAKFNIKENYEPQGLCYNNKTDKIIIAGKSQDDLNQTLYIYDPGTKTITRQVDYTTLGHCNTLTYNENTNEYICITTVSNLVFIDSETMLVKNIKTVSETITGLAYNKENDVYIAIGGTSGNNYLIYKYNNSFELLNTMTVPKYDNGYTNGIATYKNNIMLLTSGAIYQMTLDCDIKKLLYYTSPSAPVIEFEDVDYINENKIIMNRYNDKGIMYLYYGDNTQFKPLNLNKDNIFYINTYNNLGVDCDGYTAPGLYNINAIANMPTGQSNGVLNVFTSYSNGWVIQKFMSYSETGYNKEFIREKISSNWTQWREINTHNVTVSDNNFILTKKNGNVSYLSKSTVSTTQAINFYNTNCGTIYYAQNYQVFLPVIYDDSIGYMKIADKNITFYNANGSEIESPKNVRFSVTFPARNENI